MCDFLHIAANMAAQNRWKPWKFGVNCVLTIHEKLFHFCRKKTYVHCHRPSLSKAQEEVEEEGEEEAEEVTAAFFWAPTELRPIATHNGSEVAVQMASVVCS